MSKLIITVIGATGNQGRAICTAFNESGKWHVRALTRNPSGTKAQELAQAGVEVIKGNWEDPADLAKIFDGAYAVYSMTYPPWFENTLSEVDSGKLQAQAAKDAGVKLFLWSTLPYIGDYKGLGGVEVFDNKAKVNDFIKSIGLPAIFVSLCPFLESVVDWPLYKLSTDKKTLECWNYVIGKDTPVSLLWLEHDLGPSVLALVTSMVDSGKPLSEHPLNHTIQPIGSFRLPWSQVFQKMGEIAGLQVTHTHIPTVDERWHPDLTKGLQYQELHGLYPDTELPTKTVKDLGVKPGALEDFIRKRVLPRLEQ